MEKGKGGKEKDKKRKRSYSILVCVAVAELKCIPTLCAFDKRSVCVGPVCAVEAKQEQSFIVLVKISLLGKGGVEEGKMNSSHASSSSVRALSSRRRMASPYGGQRQVASSFVHTLQTTTTHRNVLGRSCPASPFASILSTKATSSSCSAALNTPL